jgi:hypothetical protein
MWSFRESQDLLSVRSGDRTLLLDPDSGPGHIVQVPYSAPQLRRATSAASPRETTPSLDRIRDTWTLAVLVLM